MPSAFKKPSIKQQRAPTKVSTKVSTPKKIIKKQQDTKKPSNEKATTLQKNKDNFIYYFAEVVFLLDGESFKDLERDTWMEDALDEEDVEMEVIAAATKHQHGQKRKHFEVHIGKNEVVNRTCAHRKYFF